MKKNYQPTNMLVTGGAGFIGSNFIHHVLQRDKQITIINVDKLTYAGSLQSLVTLSDHGRHHFIQADICDEARMSEILQEYKIDTIVHFAAESHVDRSIATPLSFVETNIIGTYILLESARKYWLENQKLSATQCRFHHISTDEVYGALTLHDKAFTELSAYRPRSPYSASKASSDHLVNAYYHTYDLPITMSHCSNNYGPHQNPEKFIPTIILSCIAQKKIPVYGEGKQIRDWLFVEDHCRGVLDILYAGQVGESYDMGGRDEWENMTLAHTICEQMDKLFARNAPHAALIQKVTDRPGHDFRYAIDTTKMATHLNWTPQISFADGLTHTINFYLQQANAKTTRVLAG